MRRWRFSVVSVMGFLLAVALAGVGEARLSPGNQAPNFTLRLHDSTQTVSLYDYAGFVMADGAVRFITDEMDPVVYRSQASRAGGETITVAE